MASVHAEIAEDAINIAADAVEGFQDSLWLCLADIAGKFAYTHRTA